MDESLIYEVLSVVEEIPAGKVATYGQIAALIGREKNARLVGRILSMAQYYGQYPLSSQPCGPNCSRLERTGRNSCGRRGMLSEKRVRRLEGVSVDTLTTNGNFSLLHKRFHDTPLI